MIEWLLIGNIGKLKVSTFKQHSPLTYRRNQLPFWNATTKSKNTKSICGNYVCCIRVTRIQFKICDWSTEPAIRFLLFASLIWICELLIRFVMFWLTPKPMLNKIKNSQKKQMLVPVTCPSSFLSNYIEDCRIRAADSTQSYALAIAAMLAAVIAASLYLRKMVSMWLWKGHLHKRYLKLSEPKRQLGVCVGASVSLGYFPSLLLQFTNQV